MRTGHRHSSAETRQLPVVPERGRLQSSGPARHNRRSQRKPIKETRAIWVVSCAIGTALMASVVLIALRQEPAPATRIAVPVTLPTTVAAPSTTTPTPEPVVEQPAPAPETTPAPAEEAPEEEPVEDSLPGPFEFPEFGSDIPDSFSEFFPSNGFG